MTKSLSKQTGFSLIGLLLTISLSIFILAGFLHYMRSLVRVYVKHTQQLNQQHTIVLATQHFAHDIHNAGFNYCDAGNNQTALKATNVCNTNNRECALLLPYDIQQRITRHDIKANSDILILNSVAENFKIFDSGVIECTPLKILYYLRRSIVHSNKYALYRDDLIHNSVALLDGFKDLHVTSHEQNQHQIISIELDLLNQPKITLTLTTRNIMAET